MPSTPNQPEEKFLEAGNYWNLEKLYIDLARINGGKPLTPTKQEFLRGILLYKRPGEIAKIYGCKVDWVKQALGQVYPLIENLLNLPEKTCRLYNKVPFLLKEYEIGNNNQSNQKLIFDQVWQNSQETEHNSTSVDSYSEPKIWQTLDDVLSHLEIFYLHCEQEEYIEAFYTVFDSDDYDNCIYNFLSSSGYIHEIVNLYERLLQSWQPRKSEKWEFQVALTCLGDAYHRLEKHHEAIDKYQQALKIAQEINDSNGEGGSLVNLGFVYYSLEQYPEAMEYIYRGLEMARYIGNQEIQAHALNNLGLVYSSLEQYHLAIDYHHHSLEIKQKLADRQGEAGSLINIGDNHRILGNYQQAVRFLIQGIEIAQQSGDRQFEANGWYNLGLALENIEQNSEAITAYKNARKLFQDMGLDAHVKDCDDAIKVLSQEIDSADG